MSLRAALCLTIFALCSAGGRAQAGEGDVVEGVGEAQIQNGDMVAAKKAATADALRRCVEKVVGIAVQSDFSSEQREVVKDNESKFNSSVRDSITQKSEGFIQSYEVVRESTAGTVLSVTVHAKVFESKIKAEVKKLGDLIAAAGNPKLMLVIQEVYYDEAGGKRVAKESTVAAHLEKELLARGFELRGAKAAKSVADDSIETYDKWLDDAGGAAKMARDNGADILIAGRVEIRDKGVLKEAPSGFDALVGQTRIEIKSVVRGVNSSSGEVLSSKPVQITEYGMNVERAVLRALQGRGANMIKQTFDALLEDFKATFKKTAEQGRAYVINLKGVKSFRKQGQGFLDAVKALGGVSLVKQKSFDGGTLVLDVAYKGSAHDLQQAIFAAADKTDGLSTIDIESVSGSQLSFKL